MEFLGMLVVGAFIGFSAGKFSTTEPSEEDMLYRLVIADASRRIKSRTREQLEKQIAEAGSKVANEWSKP